MIEPIRDIPGGYIENSHQKPNWYADRLMRLLTAEENMVLDCVCRLTFGWGKRRDRISRSQVEAMTGLSRSAVDRAYEGLAQGRVLLFPDGVNHSRNGTVLALNSDEQDANWEWFRQRQESAAERQKARTEKATAARRRLTVPSDGQVNEPQNPVTVPSDGQVSTSQLFRRTLLTVPSDVANCSVGRKHKTHVPNLEDVRTAPTVDASLAETCPPVRNAPTAATTPKPAPAPAPVPDGLTRGEAYRRRANELRQDPRVQEALYTWRISLGGQNYETWIDFLAESWERGLDVTAEDHVAAAAECAREFAAKRRTNPTLQPNPRWLLNCLHAQITAKRVLAVGVTNPGDVDAAAERERAERERRQAERRAEREQERRDRELHEEAQRQISALAERGPGSAEWLAADPGLRMLAQQRRATWRRQGDPRVGQEALA